MGRVWKTLIRKLRTYHWHKGGFREKDEHGWSYYGGRHDVVRHSNFGSVVATERLVGVDGPGLCQSGKAADRNERCRRCAENGTTGSAPVRGRSHLLLGSDPRVSGW